MTSFPAELHTPAVMTRTRPPRPAPQRYTACTTSAEPQPLTHDQETVR
ncbi:hypothetical protein Pd630_LPD12062 (plasmid) [Rhodococcus opacus PD630]|nr:hypothetical protein Pd630_LPD12062 [Rhodococcus opacus PD630]